MPLQRRLGRWVPTPWLGYGWKQCPPKTPRHTAAGGQSCHLVTSLEMEDLVSPERKLSQCQIARELDLTHPVLPVFLNLEAFPEMEKVNYQHYQGKSVILGTQQLSKLQSLEEKG